MNRRQFLHRSGLALSALAVAPSAIAVNTAPKPVRVGVVGGGFGCSFPWHNHPDAVVAALADLREDRRRNLLATYPCQNVYNSLAELVMDKNVDAVAIFTDGPLHVQHTIAAMSAGKHVISAVPAAWGTLEQAELLRDTVRKYGLTYMMAETGYFQQSTISARDFFRRGLFGNLYYAEAEYQHNGLEGLYFENGKRTWRHGVAPMHYPTHCTSQLVGVTGERLVEVVCRGWGDENPILKENAYKNPFWNASAMFGTDRGNSFRVNVWWKGAHRGCERAQWIGDKMSFYMAHPNGLGAVLVRDSERTEKDDAGFERKAPAFEAFKVPEWWKTDLLPEKLRYSSGHEGSHPFLVNEFINSIVQGRRPAVDVNEALAYTVPGIVAHQSALKGGEQLKIPQIVL